MHVRRRDGCHFRGERGATRFHLQPVTSGLRVEHKKNTNDGPREVLSADTGRFPGEFGGQGAGKGAAGGGPG